MLLSIAVAIVFSLIVMALVWLWAVRIRNASIVDVAWSALFTPLAVLYVMLGERHAPRSWLMVAMVSAWSLRLAGHLGVRIARDHPREDRRYEQLRRGWGGDADRRFFWFFEAQAIAAVVLSLPFVLAARDPSDGVSISNWAGLAVWLIGLGGEALADRQLASFRARPRHDDRVCDEGLWGWSRHPNYFFEWVTWCGFAIYALAAPLGWLAASAPAIMLYLLLRVTGVPVAEASSLRSRGDAYRAYQRRVPHAFVPWPPGRGRRPGAGG